MISRKSFPLFRLFGFQVKMDPSWIVVAVLITWTLAAGYFPVAVEGQTTTTYWVMGAAGAMGLFVSIVLHEFGHSIVARRYGIPIKGITLFIFGGVAEMEKEPPTPKSELLMAIAGPVVSVALAGGFWMAVVAGSGIGWPSPGISVLGYLGFINGVLALFNMAPAFPLDGGRVLRSILWARKGDLKGATRTTSRIGSGFGVALIVMGVASILMGNFIGGMWWFLIGMFLRGAAQGSYQHVQVGEVLRGEPVEHIMKREPVTVPANISVEELADHYFYKHRQRLFPVMRGSELVGYVSTTAMSKIPREEWAQHSVQEVLEKHAEEHVARPDDDAMEVLTRMQRHGQTHRMVLENGRLVGVITTNDILGFLALKLEIEEGESPPVSGRELQSLPR